MPRQVDAGQFDQLVAQSRQQLVEFLNTEIQLAGTFTEMAATERDLGNQEHFAHAKADVKKAVDTIRHFLGRVEDEETRAAISERCAELERVLTTL
jgi:hypothetical protein